MKQTHTHVQQKDLLIGVAAFSAAVGALAALLFAPKQGRETRRDVKDQAANVKDRLLHTKHGLDEAKERDIKERQEIIKLLAEQNKRSDKPNKDQTPGW